MREKKTSNFVSAAPDGRCNTPNQVISCAGRFDLTVVSAENIPGAHTFAAARLGGAIASCNTLEAIQKTNGAALFCYRAPDGTLEGVFAGFGLRANGAEACASAKFDATDVNPDFVCRPGEKPHAWYGWGFVGVTKRSAYAVVAAARAIQSELFWNVPAFARAVTPLGQRITERIGYCRLLKGDDSYVWIAPRPSMHLGVHA